MSETTRYFLLPGELCVTREAAEINTLLGSCVAICLYNRKFGFGGMNHYMLPKAPAGAEPSAKHGDYSSEILIGKMLDLDGAKSNLEAYVMGGGNVTGFGGNDVLGIGAHNIVMARDLLERHGIPISKRSVGGEYGRKIFFKSWSGEIEIRRIEKSAQAKVISEKKLSFSGRRIKVLIVDDSQTIRDILSAALSRDPQIEVVGAAADPYEARALLLEHDPDVICLDVIMPRMDGITFLKKLFLYSPKPVIVISTVVQKGSKLREQAEKIGAVDVIDKEDLNLYQDPEKTRMMLIGKIKAAATVWVKKKTRDELSKI